MTLIRNRIGYCNPPLDAHNKARIRFLLDRVRALESGQAGCVFKLWLCLTVSWDNNYLPLHAQIAMNHADIRKLSRVRKCRSESRDSESWRRKSHLILRRG